jgi:cell division protein FtsA
VVPIAGDQVTGDIAVALRTPIHHAEAIKIEHGRAQLEGNEGDNIEVPSIGDRPARHLSRHTLMNVVEPRYEELLGLLQGELRRSGFEDLVPGGVVLTGGAAKMPGLVTLAEDVFQMPVRVGVPQYFTGLDDRMRDPIYATGVGLLIYAKQHRFEMHPEYRESRGLGVAWQRVRSWLGG